MNKQRRAMVPGVNITLKLPLELMAEVSGRSARRYETVSQWVRTSIVMRLESEGWLRLGTDPEQDPADIDR